jgi:hypothetical protein
LQPQQQGHDPVGDGQGDTAPDERSDSVKKRFRDDLTGTLIGLLEGFASFLAGGVLIVARREDGARPTRRTR